MGLYYPKENHLVHKYSYEKCNLFLIDITYTILYYKYATFRNNL